MCAVRYNTPDIDILEYGESAPGTVALSLRATPADEPLSMTVCSLTGLIAGYSREEVICEGKVNVFAEFPEAEGWIAHLVTASETNRAELETILDALPDSDDKEETDDPRDLVM